MLKQFNKREDKHKVMQDIINKILTKRKEITRERGKSTNLAIFLDSKTWLDILQENLGDYHCELCGEPEESLRIAGIKCYRVLTSDTLVVITEI